VTETQATEAIYQRIADAWDEDDAAVTFENEAFEPVTDEPWIRVSRRSTTARVASLGDNGLSERRGLVIAQVFAPTDEGTARALDLAHDFRRLFERRSIPADVDPIEAVNFLVGEVRPQRESDGWYQVNVDLPYFFHDTTTS